MYMSGPISLGGPLSLVNVGYVNGVAGADGDDSNAAHYTGNIAVSRSPALAAIYAIAGQGMNPVSAGTISDAAAPDSRGRWCCRAAARGPTTIKATAMSLVGAGCQFYDRRGQHLLRRHRHRQLPSAACFGLRQRPPAPF